ncbi:MAG TPA: VOC family protein, partial [Bacillota bacterium]|nr:VOC family protein [Bacillota bacterium]
MECGIIRSARAVLHVTDLEASRAFYVDALGFIETEQKDGCLYLRGLEEHTHHSLVLKKAEEPVVEVLSYKVGSDADLEALSERFVSYDHPVEWMEKGTQHAVGRSFRVQDPAGLPLEFFSEMDHVDRL